MPNQHTGPLPADARFWRFVQKTAKCWEWLGHKDYKGYGSFMVTGPPSHKKNWKAHRFAYELLVGPIPPGLDIDHLCRNRACVKPAHLETVTNQVNILRGQGISASNARARYCPKGHPYDLFNTYQDKLGKRSCKLCKAALAKILHPASYWRVYRAKRKAEGRPVP